MSKVAPDAPQPQPEPQPDADRQAVSQEAAAFDDMAEAKALARAYNTMPRSLAIFTASIPCLAKLYQDEVSAALRLGQKTWSFPNHSCCQFSKGIDCHLQGGLGHLSNLCTIPCQALLELLMLNRDQM
jgi:hypothetical protein